MNLSPSLMCADPGHFAEEIAFLEAAGADSFHIDIMDGEFGFELCTFMGGSRKVQHYDRPAVGSPSNGSKP